MNAKFFLAGAVSTSFPSVSTSRQRISQGMERNARRVVRRSSGEEEDGLHLGDRVSSEGSSGFRGGRGSILTLPAPFSPVKGNFYLPRQVGKIAV